MNKEEKPRWAFSIVKLKSMILSCNFENKNRGLLNEKANKDDKFNVIVFVSYVVVWRMYFEK